MAHHLQKGMFVYPWDIAATGIEQVIEDFKDVGCNTLVVNSSYHHGRFFHPGREAFQYVDQSAISFTPDLTRYGRLQPVVHEEIANQNILAETRAHCEREGMDFVTWWVGLHNSSLGKEHPDLCVQNIWGDRYTYALCPSQPEVQQYAVALFEDTLVTVQPQRILTEAIAFLQMAHGDHHELILLNLSRSAEWLLSLCFCDTCCQNAEKEGVNTSEVKTLVEQLVRERVNYDMGHLEEDAYELPHLLLEYPELYQYQQARVSTVTKLVKQLGEIAKRHGVALDYMPSSSGLPANQTFFEGVSLQQTAEISDRFMALGYVNADSTAHTLRTLSRFVPDRAHAVALTLHADVNPTNHSLLEHIQSIAEANVNAVYYYNYGLLNKRRLSWVKEANAYLDQLKIEK